MHYRKPIFYRLFICIILVAAPMHAIAEDWPTWRGPNQDGTSAETGLISTWSVEGENLIWEAEFIGRSTPIVLNDRVYVIGRVGEGITQQERVACFDAKLGSSCGITNLTSFIPRSPSTESVGRASLVTPKQGISMRTVSKDFSFASTKMVISFGPVHSQRSTDGYPVTADAFTPLLLLATLSLSVTSIQDGARKPRHATATSLSTNVPVN